MRQGTQVFFDVDGVLIDGWHVNVELRKPWSSRLEEDLGVNSKQFERAFFTTADGQQESMMDSCVTGKRDLKETLGEVLPQLGYQGTVEEFVTYWFTKDSNLNAGVFEIVSQLNNLTNVDLFVATGQEHYRAAYLWNQLEFCKHFKQMFYSAAVGYHKNNQKFFDAINLQLDLPTSSEPPLFFDDRQAVVDLSIAAGWDGVVFNSVEDIQHHPRISRLL